MKMLIPILAIVLIAGCTSGHVIFNQNNQTIPNQTKSQETPSTPEPQAEQIPQSHETSPTEPEIEQPPEECIEDWYCTKWSECSSSGTEDRTCIDLNSCGTTLNKPSESQSCTLPITCTDECSYKGEKRCSEDYTQICGDYDENECLEWKKDQYCEYGCSNGECKVLECKGTFTGIVERIIDGDTLKVKGCDVSIRLALVDTPESYESGYEEAKFSTSNLCKIGYETTINQDDGQPYDKYGRIVALVYCQDKKLNAELVYNDLGIIDTRFCDESEFAKEDWAWNYGCKEALQSQSSNVTCIEITNFHYDAEGNDNNNLNDEYVTFKNNCSYPIDMTDWIVKDEAAHIYTFPTFSLGSGNTVTLYSGIGTDTETELYWGEATVLIWHAIWNNDEDTLYLRDANGNLVLIYNYLTKPEPQNCDPSYPTVCIPSSPPDLDCSDILYSDFDVLPPDPHGFDGDKDGIGCET